MESRPKIRCSNTAYDQIDLSYRLHVLKINWAMCQAKFSIWRGIGRGIYTSKFGTFASKLCEPVANCSNCQSKYQHCGGSLQSCAEKNIRFDCKGNSSRKTCSLRETRKGKIARVHPALEMDHISRKRTVNKTIIDSLLIFSSLLFGSPRFEPGGGGVVPITDYTGRFRPKGVPFLVWRYVKG